mmetsp:Transcript_22999/g.28230  ORF Transcript_22999/g.28230 Transcript_22999/m.28230 type:complete len:91 (+) Transcript_22999:99-371(+)
MSLIYSLHVIDNINIFWQVSYLLLEELLASLDCCMLGEQLTLFLVLIFGLIGANGIYTTVWKQLANVTIAYLEKEGVLVVEDVHYPLGAP